MILKGQGFNVIASVEVKNQFKDPQKYNVL